MPSGSSVQFIVLSYPKLIFTNNFLLRKYQPSSRLSLQTVITLLTYTFIHFTDKSRQERAKYHKPYY